jgi:hypothetical protein
MPCTPQLIGNERRQLDFIFHDQNVCHGSPFVARLHHTEEKW